MITGPRKAVTAELCTYEELVSAFGASTLIIKTKNSDRQKQNI